MKELVELLKKRGLLLRELRRVDNKELGIRKRVEIYEGLDTSNRYILIVKVGKKSRFLKKDAEGLLRIKELVQSVLSHGFKRYVAVLEGPVCSKAKEFLQQEGWSVYAL